MTKKITTQAIPDDGKWPFSDDERLDRNSVVQVAPITILPKYDRSILANMSKAELWDLITHNEINVKSRATKSSLIEALSKL